MTVLRITWTRSYIGRNRLQRNVIQSLGLRRLHQTVEHRDSPTIRGMVNKVGHMLEVEEVEPVAPAPEVTKRKARRSKVKE